MRDLAMVTGIVMLMLCSGFIGVSEARSGIREEELGEAAGYGMEKLSNVLITGTVVCEACTAGNIATQPHPISGAVVGVACRSSNRTKVMRVTGIADSYGDFIIDLPSELHANPYLERTCVVKILKVPRKSLCKATFAKKHKAIKLSSVGNGIREYTAGEIRLHNLIHTAATARDCVKRATHGM